MNILFNDFDQLYNALLAKDRSFDNHIYVCVKTTNIFCRLSCTAKKPKRENVFFCETAGACLEQGYRPCKICKPLSTGTNSSPVYQMLMQHLEKRPDHIWSETDIIKLGFDPSTVRRIFKRTIGITFLDLARLRRKSLGLNALAQGASVIEAQLEAGYDSGSGFREAINKLIGTPPEALKGRALLTAAWLETPIGQMLAISDHHKLHLLKFFDRKSLSNELQKLQKLTQSYVTYGRTRIIDQIENELTAYYEGRDCRFETPLAIHGSPFTSRVWEALRMIAPGTTKSYAELARMIDHPTAMRAVARANGQNQIAIIIPCHRVIGSDGSLTGYAGGLWRKDWLLRHEKRFFS